MPVIEDPRSLLSDVAIFAHIACRPEDALDLGKAALMLAEPEYPGLDIGAYLGVFDELAEDARPKVAGIRDAASQGASLVAHLCQEQGFRGNTAHYDDPRNSFLNDVLERRLGIPISLSVVMMEVARRLRVPLHGVSFPGHFLLRAGKLEETALYLDPFGGRVLGEADLRELLFRGIREQRDPRPDELQVASKRSILVRMLTNLRNLYAQAGDLGRVRLARERIHALEQGLRTPLGRGTAPGGVLQ